MKIPFKYKRFQIKIKQRFQEYKNTLIDNKLTKEQYKIMSIVLKSASENNDKILFDPITGETLIVLPELLITLKSNNISIQNHSGFLTTYFNDNAYDSIKDFVTKEVHKYRRKLKYEVSLRINKFLNEIK